MVFVKKVLKMNNNNNEEVLVEISSCDKYNDGFDECHSIIKMDEDEDNEEEEDDEDVHDESQYHDEGLTSQLLVSGPVGVAAAAAIVSSRNRRKPFSFETNPSIRKRQNNRLLRKLKHTIQEFSTRVGQQAIVLVVSPGKQTNFRVFGAKPLENIIKDLRQVIMNDLEEALASQTPAQAPCDPSLFELPPLIIDGIPTPVGKMTQAQLRAFIPLMLRYSTGRGKPGWGRESTRPPWWPKDLPWSNVRMDARSDSDKRKKNWTNSLREVVLNCYKYHGREDLLPSFPPIINVTIKNTDGTISNHQIDPKNPCITLPDGTKASIQGLDTLNMNEFDEININEHENITVVNEDNSTGKAKQEEEEEEQEQQNESTKIYQVNAVAQATLNSDGQIILTGEDGRNYPIATNGIITLPSMYQTLIDGTGNNSTTDENGLTKIQTVNTDLNSIVLQGGDGEQQVYRIISLGNALPNGFEFATIKTEETETNK